MPESCHIDKHVLEQAGDFYLDLQDSTMTAERLEAWQAWMAENASHRRAFARCETLWGVLEVAEAKDWTGFAIQTDAEMKADAGKPSVLPHPAGGSVLSMVAPSDKANKPVRKRLPYVWAGAVAASILVVFAATFLMLGTPQNGVSAPTTLHYQTTVDQHRVINLADGSIVELGASSDVSVTYADDVRMLTLSQGEAIFTVAKNPKRPFVVRAGQGSVTAIGTVFNVRKSDVNVEVRVLEGTVAVRPMVDVESQAQRGTPVPVVQPVTLVTAGRQTAYSPAGLLAPVVESDVYEGLSWRVGVLTMVDWPISDVISELNRYLTDEITIGDDMVGGLRFTGTVYPDQVDAWLEGLQQGYPIEVVRLGSSTILMFTDDPNDT